MEQIMEQLVVRMFFLGAIDPRILQSDKIIEHSDPKAHVDLLQGRLLSSKGPF